MKMSSSRVLALSETLRHRYVPATWNSGYLSSRATLISACCSPLKIRRLHADSCANRKAHKCLFCERELLVEPGHPTKKTWYHYLRQSVREAVDAAASGCPFFEWLVDEIIKSDTPLEQLDRTHIALRFESKEGISHDIFLAEVVLGTDWYSWTVGTFAVLSDYGIYFSSSAYSSAYFIKSLYVSANC
jgi:hypothetical protein